MRPEATEVLYIYMFGHLALSFLVKKKQEYHRELKVAQLQLAVMFFLLACLLNQNEKRAKWPNIYRQLQ